jgi:allophanate hydrolase subunit 2
VDLPYLAQLKPGDKIRFKEVSIEEAHDLIQQQEKDIIRLMEQYKQIENQYDHWFSSLLKKWIKYFNK